MKIGYVILHYLSEEDTIECIDSISKYSASPNHCIVVVDNGSPNGSGRKLEEKYADKSEIFVIINKKNYGFSKGNNIGIKFARHQLNCDFVVVLNNDTYLLDNNFEQVVHDEFEQSHYAVLGPQIFDPEGYNCSNPGESSIPTKHEAFEGIIIWLKILLRSFIKPNSTSPQSKLDINEGLANEKSAYHCEGCRLHGCCLVFSPVFFQIFDGFDERTFMYAEESILRLNMHRKNLKMVYNPDLHIFHKEAVTTKQVIGNARKKKNWMMLKASYAYWRFRITID